jgi:hypothetical protein
VYDLSDVFPTGVQKTCTIGAVQLLNTWVPAVPLLKFLIRKFSKVAPPKAGTKVFQKVGMSVWFL